MFLCPPPLGKKAVRGCSLTALRREPGLLLEILCVTGYSRGLSQKSTSSVVRLSLYEILQERDRREQRVEEKTNKQKGKQLISLEA